MWECDFAKEPMDYKLFWLRFIKKIWIVVAATLLGSAIVGIPYYLVNVTFGEDAKYKIVSEYYLDYAEDSSGQTYDYFNYYTWSEIVNSDQFLAMLREELPEDVVLEDNLLREYTDATVESDTRYLSTTVLTESEDKTKILATAMENTILRFADSQKELNSAKVITSPEETTITYPDVRCMRAWILGMVLGFFVGLLYVGITLVCDSSVYLPNTLERRYGIKALGCLSFTESKNNICYELKNAKKVVLVGADNKSAEAIDYIEKLLEKDCEVLKIKDDVLAENFNFEPLRNSDKVILLVEAGKNNGKRLERIIEQIKRQDIKISGGFLYQEDKMLIHHYYK